MTSEVIEAQCVCTKRALCFELSRLLKQGHYPEADDLLSKVQ